MAGALVDRQQHVGAARLRGLHPTVVAGEVAAQDRVVRHQQAHLRDAELREARVLPHPGLLVAHPDGERVGARGQGEAGGHGQGEQDQTAKGGHEHSVVGSGADTGVDRRPPGQA
jgi:hypothetical protein